MLAMLPGWAKRMLNWPIAPPMIGWAPSQTILPSSSSLKPSRMKFFVNRPDWEIPNPIAHSIFPAIGLPSAARALRRKSQRQNIHHDKTYVAVFRYEKINHEVN